MSLDLQMPPIIRSLSADERQHDVLAAVVQSLSDEPEPKLEHSLVVVAEFDGRIVGTITAERVWMVSNFWIDQSLRGSGTAEEIAKAIASLNSEALTEMLATTSRHVELLAHRMGFVPVKGTLFRHSS
jgi:hypothetical protein